MYFPQRMCLSDFKIPEKHFLDRSFIIGLPCGKKFCLGKICLENNKDIIF